MKKSIIYMLVEGVSRGIPQIILLVLALLLPESNFAKLTLLYGLESLLVIALPSNYIELLYKLQNNKNRHEIANTIFSINFITVIIVLSLLYLFNSKIVQFYNFHNIYVYIAIVISAFINSYIRFARVQFQLALEHSQAIKMMLYSFGFANVGMIIALIVFNDKIMAFFIGKSIGFLIYFTYYIYNENIKLNISIQLLVDYVKRMKYLLLFSVYSWFFGYGFSYVAKAIGTENDVANIGYIITFSMPFLLLANGINQVYVPKVRKLINVNFEIAIRFSKKILSVYVAIFIVILLMISLLGGLNYEIIQKYKYLFVISAVIFAFSIYKYVYDIYIYVYDLFKEYILGTIFIETLTMILIIVSYYFLSIDFVYLYPFLILSRSAYVLRLMKKIRLGARVEN